jgi:hypothetical protein
MIFLSDGNYRICHTLLGLLQEERKIMPIKVERGSQEKKKKRKARQTSKDHR